MGGGDTRVAKIEGHCRIFPEIGSLPEGTSVLSADTDNNQIYIRYDLFKISSLA